MAELLIVQDTHWILTKASIINKVFKIFNNQVSSLKNVLESGDQFFLPEIKSAVPKIYKGENYRSFPYVIMDYPAVFSKEHIFAVRAMFWWGNFFSITMHLSGNYKNIYGNNILKQLRSTPENFFICVNETEWEHNFDSENYLPGEGLTDADAKKIELKNFIKVAVNYPLAEWNKMPHLLENGYEALLNLLKKSASYPVK